MTFMLLCSLAIMYVVRNVRCGLPRVDLSGIHVTTTEADSKIPFSITFDSFNECPKELLIWNLKTVESEHGREDFAIPFVLSEQKDSILI